MARDFIEALTAKPVSTAEARRAEKDGGTRSARRLRLVARGSRPPPDGPRSSAPGRADSAVVVVGIAPKDAESKETLRSRILKKHSALGLANSTLRRSLAALLWEQEGWTPRLTEVGRFKLSTEDDAALLAWQE
jgi:hypothetical protein